MSGHMLIEVHTAIRTDGCSPKPLFPANCDAARETANSAKQDLSFTGYRLNLYNEVAFWVIVVLTAGLGYLPARWSVRWWLALRLARRCASLNEATHILLQARGTRQLCLFTLSSRISDHRSSTEHRFGYLWDVVEAGPCFLLTSVGDGDAKRSCKEVPFKGPGQRRCGELHGPTPTTSNRPVILCTLDLSCS